jgi:hypothetical protein
MYICIYTYTPTSAHLCLQDLPPTFVFLQRILKPCFEHHSHRGKDANRRCRPQTRRWRRQRWLRMSPNGETKRFNLQRNFLLVLFSYSCPLVSSCVKCGEEHGFCMFLLYPSAATKFHFRPLSILPAKSNLRIQGLDAQPHRPCQIKPCSRIQTIRPTRPSWHLMAHETTEKNVSFLYFARRLLRLLLCGYVVRLILHITHIKRSKGAFGVACWEPDWPVHGEFCFILRCPLYTAFCIATQKGVNSSRMCALSMNLLK